MSETLAAELKNLVKKFGLSSFELKAYLYLLKAGKSSAQEISNNANIPLTRVYSVMKQLEKKGLISINKLDSPTRYSVKDPESSLRFMLKKYRMDLNSEAEKLERTLENVLKNINNFPNENFPEWTVHHDDKVVYRSLIPSLVGSSKREVVIVGRNVNQTMTMEFLEEFRKALDRGVVFKTIVPLNADSIFKSFSGFFGKIFGLAKLANMTREHWEKNLFMKKNELDNITPFGIFDRSKVGFSITSPANGRYLVTLVTDRKDVVEDFYEIFQTLWKSSIDLEVPPIFAKVLKIR